MKKFTSLILTATAIAFALPASAQFAKPEDAIKYRKSALSVMGTHFGRVAAMATGKAPFDAKSAADNAAVAEMMGKLPWAAFSPDTATGESKAKPEIWKDKAKFDDLTNKMQTELGKLSAAAKTGNLDNLKTAFAAAGGSCKSCHDDFKAK